MSALPSEASERKAVPVFTGVVSYFPLTIAALARLAVAGNAQHNPGKPLHWDRSKSADHLDCMLRHAMDAGKVDKDGHRHAVKAAWRALANAELELEAAELSPCLRIYVAGPYTGDGTRRAKLANIRRAVNVGRELFRKGHHPHVPHAATDFLDGHGTWDDFMRLDLELIERWASALFYLGPSPGADRELAFAKRLGLKVFTALDEVPDVRGTK